MRSFAGISRPFRRKNCHIIRHRFNIGHSASVAAAGKEVSILDADHIAQDRPAARAQRAVGNLLLRAKPSHLAQGSVLADLRHGGCLKALFPRGPADRLSAVIVNTSGGITGGDDLRIKAQVGSGARLSLTSQAAERIYRSQTEDPGRVDTHLVVADAARVDWLPQETILYDRAALDRRLRVDLGAGARCLLVETLVFGRAAMGERLQALSLSDRIEIWHDDAPFYIDRVRLSGDAATLLTRRAIGQGAGAVATVVLAAPDDHDQTAQYLDALRPMLPDHAGVSLVRPGLLVVRMAAPDSFLLRQTLVPVLALLNDGPLPRTWML